MIYLNNIISPSFKQLLKETLDAIKKISDLLKKNDISFCIIGGSILPFYGYRRFTEDIDILVSVKDKEKMKRLPIGIIGEHSKGSLRVWQLHDPKTKIDVLFSNDKISDLNKYEEPEEISHLENGIPIINLHDFIKYKILSGVYGSRLRDFSDVEELIIANSLKKDYMKREESTIKEKYIELFNNTKKRKNGFEKLYK